MSGVSPQIREYLARLGKPLPEPKKTDSKPFNDPDDSPGEAELLIRKNRHGDPGTVKLTWNGKLMRFSNHQPLEGVGNDF